MTSSFTYSVSVFLVTGLFSCGVLSHGIFHTLCFAALLSLYIVMKKLIDFLLVVLTLRDLIMTTVYFM